MHGLKAFSALVPSRTSVVTSAPFLAALLAPAATLFDIPALSQRWYELNGEQQSDPAASLILSAISLAFSVMANTLLVIRFTIDNPRRWRMAIRISTMGWFLKTAVGLANLIVFGATRRNGPGYVYIEGFWCAILSCILSGIVTLLLSAQYLLNKQDRPEGSVNLDCRMLIMSEMILFGVMALEALIFSRVEGWSYLDGLYFSVVSLLTIGFGNFAPTKTSTKILLFPFSIVGIALLSNQVTLITSVSSRMTSRYRQQLNYGPTLHRKLTRQLTLLGNKVDGLRGGGKDKDKNGGDDKAPFPALSSSPTSTSSRQTDDELMCEVKRLKHIHAMQQGASELFEFLFSLLLLVVFWFVSGAVFQAIEHWTFGDAMYFSYVFFLTIGYGDFAPNTPAGKTLFVFWAMLAVPIMTNFVVQTIQTIVSRVSTLITNRARERRTEWYDYVATYFVPHTDLVDQIRRDIDEETTRAQEKDDDQEKENQQQKTSSISFNNTTTASEKTAAEVEAEAASPSSANTMLLRRLMNKSSENEEDTVTVSRADLLAALEQSILLESECRAMLIDQMKTGSAQWLLLKADTNLQQNHAIVHRVKQSAARGGRKKKHHKRKINNGLTDKEKREKEAEAEEDEQINDSNADPHLVKELQKTSSKSMIERVNTYRQTYARFLVLAGRLMDLHGQQLLEWEHDTEEQGRELIG